MKKLIFLSIVLILGSSLMSCQKAFTDPDDTQVSNNNVTFNIRQFEQVPFDNTEKTRTKDIKDVCKNLCLTVYFGSERIKDVKQKSTDANFGTLSLKLDEGTYQAMIVAHNQNKSPATKNHDKVQFNNDLGDVFFWTKEITVNEDTGQDFDVDMHRQVAMVRFVTTDNVPEDVDSIKFYYTGGSAALNASTGLGSVNSKQTAFRKVTNDMKGKPATFEIYTIPKNEKDNYLKIEVTGYNAKGEETYSHNFENVAIERNLITVFKGELFTVAGSTSAKDDMKFNVTTNDEWDTVENEY